MKLAFTWDDGALEDQKLFTLHETYEIPGMFFVPSKNREGRPVLPLDQLRRWESPYVSFGGHTKNHTYLPTISLAEVEEVRANQADLEDALGHAVPHFCLPGGRYNEEILEVIYRHYETVRTADIMNFSQPNKLLKPSIHFYPRRRKAYVGNALRHQSYGEMFYLAANMWKSYFPLMGT